MAQIHYRLDELLAHYDLSAYRLALEIKQRPETIRAMQHNQLRRLNEPVLLAICDYFHRLNPLFTLADLMEFIPDSDSIK
jgi:DNA-binding Xre family transcriptional regulator